MYLKTKKQVLDLIQTIKEAVKYMKTHPQEAEAYLEPCLQAAGLIADILSSESDALEKFLEVQCFFDKILHEEQTAEEWNVMLQTLTDLLHFCSKSVKEVTPRLKVFFLPYKAEMWAALESIWQAFSKDPMCDTYVMPIPYHTLKMTKNGQVENDLFCYEADKYSHEIPIVNYAQIDLQREQPDVIFIHNPYDENNTLTRVPEQYYARNLREVTDMLVYSPYFTVSGINPKEGGAFLLTAALKYAHKTIVQSDKLAKVYRALGVSQNKLLVSGSPKIDAVVHGLQDENCVPKKWLDKLQGQTVFLLNTHLSYFLRPEKDQKLRLRIIKYLLEEIKSNAGTALIWRPHPLMMSMLKSRGELYLLNELKDIMDSAEQSDKVIIDRNSSYLPAFNASHAMFSTVSSLVVEYMLTGNPTIYIDHDWIKCSISSQEVYFKNGPVALDHNYFASDYEDFFRFYKKEYLQEWQRYEEAKKNAYKQFIEMVQRKEDSKKKARLNDVKSAFVGSEGTSGLRSYQMIKKIILAESV